MVVKQKNPDQVALTNLFHYQTVGANHLQLTLKDNYSYYAVVDIHTHFQVDIKDFITSKKLFEQIKNSVVQCIEIKNMVGLRQPSDAAPIGQTFTRVNPGGDDVLAITALLREIHTNNITHNINLREAAKRKNNPLYHKTAFSGFFGSGPLKDTYDF